MVRYEDCLRSQINGKAFVEVDGNPIRLDDIIRNIAGCNYISNSELSIDHKIGEVHMNTSCDFIIHSFKFTRREDLEWSSRETYNQVMEVRM
jgi:hypothetical protein